MELYTDVYVGLMKESMQLKKYKYKKKNCLDWSKISSTWRIYNMSL